SGVMRGAGSESDWGVANLAGRARDGMLQRRASVAPPTKAVPVNTATRTTELSREVMPLPLSDNFIFSAPLTTRRDQHRRRRAFQLHASA
ncbi:MAG: hypothetical protein ACOC8C_01575, partial [Chloroflexota bacterium]